MLDRYFISPQEKLLGRPAEWLVRRGVSADMLTITGFLIGLSAVPLIAFGQFGLALVAILVNRLFDGLDGVVARLSGPTDRGAFLDIALDFFFYATIPFAFVLVDPVANAVPGAMLLLSFVGTGSSFLAFAVIAERRGLTSLCMPKKGLYYLGGIAEGTETIAFLVLACLLPQAFPILATIFAGLCFVTALARWWWGYTAFSAR
ncbi:CDP-alcohol phosphatidyltransferase family protein [Devosia sp.]|jgi:phosphatidylglycerophosphate synthase|uniref:CDP-alcohol phosphatidyltransferase family protein n=1 Tax=Devosia sp. TaxID=1871048 RepID=UPI0037C17B1E